MCLGECRDRPKCTVNMEPQFVAPRDIRKVIQRIDRAGTNGSRIPNDADRAKPTSLIANDGVVEQVGIELEILVDPELAK